MRTSVDQLIDEQQRSLEVLRERCRLLEEALAPSTVYVPIEWRLTSSEARVFACLASRDLATKQQITLAIYSDRPDDEPEMKIIDVFICKIRRKLRPFNIVISTVWGHGWLLEQRHKYQGAT